MSTSGAAGLVRRWVRFYTRGLAPELRDARREEIDADLWFHLEEGVLIGRSARATNLEILVRWVAGIPADLRWRFEHRGDGGHEMARLATAVRSLGIGGLLVFGGLGLIGLFFRYASVTTDDRLIWVGSAADLAIAMALGGLVVRYRDSLDENVVIVGWLGVLAAALGSVLYFAVAFLPLLTVPLVVNIAKAGGVGRWIAGIHAAAGGLYVFGILVGLSGGGSTAIMYVVLSYPLSLVLLGLAIAGGAVRPQHAVAPA